MGSLLRGWNQKQEEDSDTDAAAGERIQLVMLLNFAKSMTEEEGATATMHYGAIPAQRLNHDVLSEIFSFLALDDLAVAARGCSMFASVVADDEFWRRRVLNTHGNMWSLMRPEFLLSTAPLNAPGRGGGGSPLLITPSPRGAFDDDDDEEEEGQALMLLRKESTATTACSSAKVAIPTLMPWTDLIDGGRSVASIERCAVCGTEGDMCTTLRNLSRPWLMDRQVARISRCVFCHHFVHVNSSSLGWFECPKCKRSDPFSQPFYDLALVIELFQLLRQTEAEEEEKRKKKTNTITSASSAATSPSPPSPLWLTSKTASRCISMAHHSAEGKARSRYCAFQSTPSTMTATGISYPDDDDGYYDNDEDDCQQFANSFSPPDVFMECRECRVVMSATKK